MLSTITHVTVGVPNIGWKVVTTNNKTPFCGNVQLSDKWTEDKNDFTLRTSDGRKYETGFHIWDSEGVAREFDKVMGTCTPQNRKVVKVEYDELRAVGLDVWGKIGGSNLLEEYHQASLWKCVVARKIRIIQ